MTITRFTEHDIEHHSADLAQLLQDAVSDGASVGFITPLSDDEAKAYWQQIKRDVAQDKRVVLAAKIEGEVAGVVQLELNSKQNACHRAEVQKLMVSTQYRRRGLGQQLMAAVESVAQAEGISLIVLDTRQGDLAEGLYRKLDYIESGVIPQFALSSAGTLDATVYFYKLL